MIAEFYLLNHSFRYQEGISVKDLEEGIKDLEADYSFIREYKETDKVYKHESIYGELIYEDLTVADLLYYGKGKGVFNRDTLEALRRIIDVSELQNITIEEVIEILLPSHNEQNIFGLLCLHQIDFIEEKYLVYNKNNWLSFHRYFLGIYPNNEDYFFNELKKYYPNLLFHKDINQTLATLEGGLFAFAQSIIFCLNLLNDEFERFKNNPYSRIETLRNFSSTFSIDVTPQGNLKDKPYMTFSFENLQGKQENICCEPHIKLNSSDLKGDNHFYFNRIYFHEGNPNFNKILIGHIGKHIDFK